jgi:hypothetical protein
MFWAEVLYRPTVGIVNVIKKNYLHSGNAFFVVYITVLFQK